LPAILNLETKSHKLFQNSRVRLNVGDHSGELLNELLFFLLFQ
jgi:hypothetical protein